MTRSLALTEQEKNRMATENVGLPNRCYTDPRFLEYENDQLFKHTWVAVGVGSEIPNRGDARPLNVAGVPIIIVRNAEGKISAFHNVCAHRGVKLLDEPCSGKRMLVCPYHAWGYNLEGKLMATPNIGGEGENELEGFDRSCHGLKTVRADMWMDVIFVNLSGDAEPLEMLFKPLNDRWNYYDCSQICHAGVEDGILIDDLQANWKVVAENYTDTYHLPFVHGLSLQEYSPLNARYCFHESGHFIGIGSNVYTPDRGDRMPQFPGLSPDQAKGVEYCYVFPNLCLGISATHMMVNIVEPLSHNSTRMNIHTYFANSESLSEAYQSQRHTMIREFKQVLSEDYDIANRLQSGRESPAFDGGCFSDKADVTIKQLHDWFAKEL